YPLRPRNTIDSRYLLTLLLGEDFSCFATAVSMRSGFPKINRDELGGYWTDLPPLEEQRRIADILDAADTAIRQTESVIGKLRQMKAGLLHDLLTCGLDEHGRLRHSLAPTGWSKYPLRVLAEVGTGVTLGRDVQGSGAVEVPYLRVANVQDGYVDLSEV